MGVCFDCLVVADGRPNRPGLPRPGPPRRPGHHPGRGRPCRVGLLNRRPWLDPAPGASALVDLAVVGAGPAGPAAVNAAADLGLSCVLLDAAALPGGQSLRADGRRPAGPAYRRRCTTGGGCSPGSSTGWRPTRPPVPSSTSPGTTSGPCPAGPGTGGWQPSPRPTAPARCRLRPYRPGPRGALRDRFARAPTALPRLATLPGVVGALAGPRPCSSPELVLPGRRVVVAGSGPLLLAVAASLAEAVNARVPLVVEAAVRRGLRPRRPGVLAANPGKLAEGAAHAVRLLRHGVAVRTRSAVVAAHGTDRVEAVTVARLGLPLAAGPRLRAADRLRRGGGGPRPAAAAGARAGAGRRRAPAAGRQPGAGGGGDAAQRTTVAGLWAAGESTGVGGAATRTGRRRVGGTRDRCGTGRGRPGRAPAPGPGSGPGSGPGAGPGPGPAPPALAPAAVRRDQLAHHLPQAPAPTEPAKGPRPRTRARSVPDPVPGRRWSRQPRPVPQRSRVRRLAVDRASSAPGQPPCSRLPPTVRRRWCAGRRPPPSAGLPSGVRAHGGAELQRDFQLSSRPCHRRRMAGDPRSEPGTSSVAVPAGPRSPPRPGPGPCAAAARAIPPAHAVARQPDGVRRPLCRFPAWPRARPAARRSRVPPASTTSGAGRRPRPVKRPRQQQRTATAAAARTRGAPVQTNIASAPPGPDHPGQPPSRGKDSSRWSGPIARAPRAARTVRPEAGPGRHRPGSGSGAGPGPAGHRPTWSPARCSTAPEAFSAAGPIEEPTNTSHRWLSASSAAPGRRRSAGGLVTRQRPRPAAPVQAQVGGGVRGAQPSPPRPDHARSTRPSAPRPDRPLPPVR